MRSFKVPVLAVGSLDSAAGGATVRKIKLDKKQYNDTIVLYELYHYKYQI